LKFYLTSLIYILVIALGYLIYKKYFSKLDKILQSLNDKFPEIKYPKVLSIYRLSHCICCLTLSCYLIELIPFTFYKEIQGNPVQINILYLQHILWILALTSILFGTNLRLIYIANFLLTYTLLDSNIGDVMLKISAFWMIFILPSNHYCVRANCLWFLGLSMTNPNHSEKWAVYLLGVNISFIITISGIFKLLDPVWFSGLGFYYSYLQPWIHVKWTVFILDYEWLVYAMNYIAIVFESLPFFLFFFKKTRFLSFIFMLCFIGLVNFPLRIDPVGPAGIVILIAVFTILDFEKVRLKSNL